MDIKEIRKHGHGTLYWTKKEENTLVTPYVGESMEAVLFAYKKMWGREPYTIERGSQAEAIVISG